VGALEHAHARSQTKIVGYFKAVAEDVGWKYVVRENLERFSA
jgi:hypothetical protein